MYPVYLRVRKETKRVAAVLSGRLDRIKRSWQRDREHAARRTCVAIALKGRYLYGCMEDLVSLFSRFLYAKQTSNDATGLQ